MKIRPGVEYTREEVAAFRDDPELAGVLLRGYVFTLTIGGNFMLIPWNQAAGGGYTGNGDGHFDPHSEGSSYGRPVETTFDKTELPPIVKRTPQQRMDSLMSKVGEDLKLYIASQTGREVAGEEVKEIARQSIQDADNAFEAVERKKITRTTGNPYA